MPPPAGWQVLSTRHGHGLVHDHHPQLCRFSALHKSGHTVNLPLGDLAVFVAPGPRGVNADHHQLGQAVHGFEIPTEGSDVACIGTA